MTQISIIEFYALDYTHAPTSSWHLESAEVFDPTCDYEQRLTMLGDMLTDAKGKPLMDEHGLYEYEEVRDPTKRHRVMDTADITLVGHPWRDMSYAERADWCLAHLGQTVQVWQSAIVCQSLHMRRVFRQLRLSSQPNDPTPLHVAFALGQTIWRVSVADLWDVRTQDAP